MDFPEQVIAYAEEPLTRQIILSMLKDYKRPYDKISELVKKGMLIPVKRGIYAPGPKLKIPGPEPMLLANHILGPSYVSMETALSHWGMIPEKVFEITSVTIRASKTYRTQTGRFSYIHLPLPYYAFGIQQVALTQKQTVLIASPEKALCDKIICTPGLLLRSISRTLKTLTEDLRIDEDSLRKLDLNQIRAWRNNAPKNESIDILVRTIQQL
ncbi:MAG: hypothetical protein JST75_12565 [Bacteroidetes bacterium]|nr:hypothetical protein [Bacteroidota bacterium]